MWGLHFVGGTGPSNQERMFSNLVSSIGLILKSLRNILGCLRMYAFSVWISLESCLFHLENVSSATFPNGILILCILA
jgi:hypothetical protein